MKYLVYTCIYKMHLKTCEKCLPDRNDENVKKKM